MLAREEDYQTMSYDSHPPAHPELAQVRRAAEKAWQRYEKAAAAATEAYERFEALGEDASTEQRIECARAVSEHQKEAAQAAVEAANLQGRYVSEWGHAHPHAALAHFVEHAGR